ncbi:hypothetical protein [Coleofasciculus sp.]|uniref:hypothetical protein n=1 Tax=Coleofasciculus sp. TaxID=3100458 RepID=UPI0039FB31DE
MNSTLTPEQIEKRELFLPRSKPDLLPDILSRKRLYVLLVDSMAVKGISELDIFEKTSISENLLSKIRDIDMEFKFGRSCLERLAPYLLKVEDWEELRPVFKLPYIYYQGWVDYLIEDLQFNQLIPRFVGLKR